MFLKSVRSKTVTSGQHEKTDREIVSSGGQHISEDCRDIIATSGRHNSYRHASGANNDNEIDGVMSLQSYRDEEEVLS